MAATDYMATFWNVDNLYLIIGAGLAISSIGYVYYYFVDRRFEYMSLSKQEDVLALSPVEEEKLLECEEEIMFSASRPPPAMSRNKRLIFILLMTSFNFFFAGVEGSFKNFIPAFSSHCLLHLSRQEGSSLSGLFFGTYTINRILLIVGSMYASATTDMWLSLLLCALSCAVLHTWGQSNKLGLQIGWIMICYHSWVQTLSGIGLQGAGSAAVFSTTFLWLETLMPVTNGIGAAYTVAWNIAVQVNCLNLRTFPSYFTSIRGLFSVNWTIYSEQSQCIPLFDEFHCILLHC